MRTPDISTISYTPGILQGLDDVRNELFRISGIIAILAAGGHLDKTTVAPTKPRDGDIRYADGTLWNPGGGGEGAYMYYNSAWNRLG